MFYLSCYSYGEFQAYCRQKKNKTFILKPDSGSQGKGIFLTKNPKVHLYCNCIAHEHKFALNNEKCVQEKTQQEVIHFKSQILFKLGTNVGFGEEMIVAKK